MDITFDEVIKGGNKIINYKAQGECSTCLGTGIKEKSIITTCRVCTGKGYTVSGRGVFQNIRICFNCKGEGNFLETPCVNCKGKGTMEVTRRFSIPILKGIDHGHFMRLQGKGNLSKRLKSVPGDLLIRVNIVPHPQFTRNGIHVHTSVPITITQAILGDYVTVPTLQGDQKIKLHRGTQPGSIKKLYFRGFQSGWKRGHFYIHWKVKIPDNISEKQIELFANYADDEIKPKLKLRPPTRSLAERIFQFLNTSVQSFRKLSLLIKVLSRIIKIKK